MVVSSWLHRLIARLFPKVTRYEIAPAAFKTMRHLAQETHPKEAFGVLRGAHQGNTLYVRDVAFQPFANTTRSATAAIDEYTITDMVGTFHSHPSPNVQPSAADLRLFSKHPGVHCIIGYPYNHVAVYDHRGRLLNLHKL